MYKSFYLVIYILLSNIIFIACVSHKDEHLNNSDEIFIFHLDTLLGSNPELVCNKIDSIISSGVHNDEFYSLLMIKSKAKLFLSEYDSVFILLDSIEGYCSKISEENTPYRLLSSVNNMRGNLYARRSVMDSAVIYFQKAYDYSSKLGLSHDLIDITINLADANVRSGKFDQGSFWYRRSLSISDTLMLPENRRFPSYYGLAQVYMDLRDYDKCDFYYDLAGRYFDDMLPFEKHIYLNNRGNSYYYRGEYDKAMDYFRESLQLANKYPDMEFERKFTKVNMGEVFMLMNETDSATAYLEECYSFFNQMELSLFGLNQVAESFLEKVEKEGYDGMLYGSKNYLNSIWKYHDYDVWLAHYTDETDYDDEYVMWQLCQNGVIDGINGMVDINILFRNI